MHFFPLSYCPCLAQLAQPTLALLRVASFAFVIDLIHPCIGGNFAHIHQIIFRDMVCLLILFIANLLREKEVLMKDIDESLFLLIDDKGKKVVSDELIAICNRLGLL